MIEGDSQDDTNDFRVLSDNDVDEECVDTERQDAENRYRNRKPKWWLHLSRKGSKAQRRAIRDMGNYTLPRTPYGEFIDWNSAFGRNETDKLSIWLEIGFGAGDNLLQLAEQYPEKCFVGAEIHQPGVGKIMQKIKYGTEHKCFWKGSSLYLKTTDQNQESYCAITNKANYEDAVIESPYSNTRIHRGDGVQLLSVIPSGTLEAVLVTNPDPFPNDEQKEWRLFQIQTLREIRRVLIPSGRLYLATDHEVFSSWSHEVMCSVNAQREVFRTVVPPPSRRLWLPVVSGYEQKVWKMGDRRFCRVGRQFKKQNITIDDRDQYRSDVNTE